ncbi:acetyl-CoA carboxylase biotin carboxyl carrier protein [Phormidesmis priestleyi ULC007]|uniref:Biotin carboxyl carrier protein of acetyl-CoA carboxylase n=1 Tax=Phormidesmis priestleyi ULC007 TaxID=1920490 RepID=A0A2T1DGY9_9CYAN|nr:acetyl-CoA carboxylase biotin carboxyl carrier protein [Phormidesmis priestleyi]PSB19727.1 acetyl-CoA carboxylase biotin carboxyl carrier protein [Phormidesmis priestleyi ULC007]PZO53611.1 MAG: acetyl-CoA carboxylase biotin carboxyl carrier protein [Phormidesmis priestleyi]
MPLDLSELRELLTALNQTDIAELILKSEDFELTVRRGSRSGSGQADLIGSRETLTVTPIVTPLPTPDLSRGTADTPNGAPSSQSAPPPSNDRLVEILSPMVGTFYRSPAPDEAPFVNVGDRIRSGQTVCIIEAMKLLNEIDAEVSGEIVEILVQNLQPVEYGQPLMRVNPV